MHTLKIQQEAFGNWSLVAENSLGRRTEVAKVECPEGTDVAHATQALLKKAVARPAGKAC